MERQCPGSLGGNLLCFAASTTLGCYCGLEEDRNIGRNIISDLRNIFIISRFDLTPMSACQSRTREDGNEEYRTLITVSQEVHLS